MKKIILPIVLLFTFLMNAQVILKPGIKLGLNMANITHNNSNIRPDFYIGGLLSIKFSESYILQPELTYSRQGARQQLDGGSNPDIELDYIHLTGANQFLLFKNIGLYAIAGAYMGFTIRDNIEYETSSLWDNYDMGLFIGLSYELFSNFEIEARYKRGLTDIHGINLSDYKHLHANKVIQIGLNYKFDRKK